MSKEKGWGMPTTISYGDKTEKTGPLSYPGQSEVREVSILLVLIVFQDCHMNLETL